MRILWGGPTPNVPSGYGVPLKNLIPYLQDAGHELAIHSFYGVGGGMINYKGVPMYPSQGKSYGVDAIAAHVRHFKPDVVITLMDNWVLPVDYHNRFEARWLSWFPVDGAPPPDACVLMAQKADYPAVFSKDGVWRMRQMGVDVTYLPYAVDCLTFKPGNKRQAREALGVPDDVWLAVTVAANRGFPSRKAFPEMLLAWQQFSKDAPNARLYLHTRTEPISEKGVYLEPLVRQLGIGKTVIFADQDAMAVGVPNESLVTLYRAADVMLLPSMGEGFGLPIIEAQACGCPVITTKCSSMPELTVNGVCADPSQPFWAAGLNYWWMTPSIENVCEALHLIHMRDNKDILWCAEQGVEFVRAHYDYSVVWDRHWAPLLERVEAELW